MRKLQQWQWAAQRLQQRLHTLSPFHDFARNVQCNFSVRHFGEDGLVVAHYESKGGAIEKGQVLIKLDFGDVRTHPECTCDKSLGDQVCNHIIQFARTLTVELNASNSHTAKRVLEGNYTKGKFDYHAFLAERSLLVVAGLANSLPSVDDNEEDVLPPVEESVPARLVWAFSVFDKDIRLEFFFQRQKKRGNGWLKGKRLTPDALLNDPSLLVTDQDRMAASCIKRFAGPTNFYGPPYKIDFPNLVKKLIGHPSVTLNDKEINTTEGPLVVVLSRDGEYSQLKVTVPFVPTQVTRCHHHESGFVYSDFSSGILHAVICTPRQIKFVQNLERYPAVIETSRMAEFLPQLERISKHIPLVLPKEIAGELQPEPIRPVLLLRSRTSGELDFGMRVRDSQGRLHKPGHGAAVHYQVDGEQPTQWRRNLSGERERMLELAEQIGIDDVMQAGEFYGSISEFARAIDLLEALDARKEELEVCWDKSTERRLQVVGSVTASNLKVQLSTKRDWFGIEGTCELENKSINLTDIIAGLNRSSSDDGVMQGEFVRVGENQWARISQRLQQRLKRLADHTHTERGKLVIDRTGAPSVQALLDEEIQVDAPAKWAETVARLRNADSLVPVVPEGLKADLRTYQQEGFAWMRRLAEWGVGGVLADDMGLGKTVQTLAVLLDRKQSGPALVIAPTSVGFNWARETERFAPELKSHLYRDTDRGELLERIGPGDVVIASYGLVLRDEEQLAKVKWGTMVLDEAQAVKNSRSKTAHSVASIGADWKLALTGTPVENHLGELWSIFRIVSPGLLGSWEQFRNKFATPIERDNCPQRRAALSSILQPFMLRRTKSAVLKDLPERTETNLYVDLSHDERAKYDSWRLAAVGEIEGLVQQGENQDARFQILAILTRLRQLACNVGLVDKTWQGESSKLARLMETMEELRSEGHRALIFSQFTEHLGKIRNAFDAAGLTYEYLDGSTPAKQRSELVDRFQNGKSDAFLISLKAGGTGLNLTAADYVIHMDPWWNPAVEDQATDRAHRIGQTRPVMVYRIIATGTIEEEILRLHESKRDLVAGILDGTSKAAKLSTEELIDLIRKG